MGWCCDRLHVPQAESLLATESADDPVWQSYPNYLDLRDRNRSFEDLAAFTMVFVGLDTGKDPVRRYGLCGDRELLRRAQDSALPGQFLSPLR